MALDTFTSTCHAVHACMHAWMLRARTDVLRVLKWRWLCKGIENDFTAWNGSFIGKLNWMETREMESANTRKLLIYQSNGQISTIFCMFRVWFSETTLLALSLAFLLDWNSKIDHIFQVFRLTFLYSYSQAYKLPNENEKIAEKRK